MGSKLTPDIIAQAQGICAKGISVREAATRLGVGKSQLAAALSALAAVSAGPPPSQAPPVPPAASVAPRPHPVAARAIPKPPPSPPPMPPGEPLTPLALARGMLHDTTGAMAGLDEESPAYARLASEKRQIVKLIAALEREAAGEETDEEIARRRRREDGETRREIERYVDQALGISLRERPGAPWGCCPTCAHPLTAESRAALMGGT